jgi:hypothetical protein
VQHSATQVALCSVGDLWLEQCIRLELVKTRQALPIAFLITFGVGHAHADTSSPAKEGAPLPPALVKGLANRVLALASMTSKAHGVLHAAHFHDSECQDVAPALVQYADSLCTDEERGILTDILRDVPGRAEKMACRRDGSGWTCSGRLGSADDCDEAFTTLYFVRDTDGRWILDAMIHSDTVPFDRRTKRFVERERARERACRP